MKREHSSDLLSPTLHFPVVAAFSRKMEGEYENISPKIFSPASNEMPTLVTAHILSHVWIESSRGCVFAKDVLKMRLPPLENNSLLWLLCVYPLYFIQILKNNETKRCRLIGMFFCFPATKSTLEGIAVSSGGGLIPIEGTWQKRFLCLDLCISEPVMPCYISIFCTLCSGLEDGRRHTPQPIPQFHPTISVKKIWLWFAIPYNFPYL